MKGLSVIPLVAVMFFVVGQGAADAGYCGAGQYRHCRPACCPAPCSCGAVKCCTVMKTCQQVVYETREFTTYETVYEDVHEPKTVDAVKYVAETELRDLTTTVWETKTEACAPVDGCGPAACCKQVPVPCIRQVPVTVFRAVPSKETLDTVRCVEKRIPRTITCRVPKVVCVQVPVEVCCPLPCCARAKCCKAAGCGG